MAGLCVDFPRGRAIDDLTLEIGSGERVALLGPSGAGKSTLLRALLGAVPATGRVSVGGRDPYGEAAREIRRATGFVRQGNDLVLGLSARLNALTGTSPSWGVREWVAVLRGRVPRRYAARLTELARHHGIESILGAPARELSGGQRQRVGLVRALLPGPRLILADEPTTGLDPVTAAAAVNALCSLDGVTAVVATHDLDIARRLPRVIALREGRLVHDGSEVDAEVYG